MRLEMDVVTRNDEGRDSHEVAPFPHPAFELRSHVLSSFPHSSSAPCIGSNLATHLFSRIPHRAESPHSLLHSRERHPPKECMQVNADMPGRGIVVGGVPSISFL